MYKRFHCLCCCAQRSGRNRRMLHCSTTTTAYFSKHTEDVRLRVMSLHHQDNYLNSVCPYLWLVLPEVTIIHCFTILLLIPPFFFHLCPPHESFNIKPTTSKMVNSACTEPKKHTPSFVLELLLHKQWIPPVYHPRVESFPATVTNENCNENK